MADGAHTAAVQITDSFYNASSIDSPSGNFTPEDQLLSEMVVVHEGPPASFAVQVAISAVIAIMCVWSGLGNLLTILAITKNQYMKTKSNCFILSLAVSDLISGLIASPLWLYRRTWGFKTWLWGNYLCKLYWFTDETTSYCTSMHIASFAIWRYIWVKWPHSIDKFTMWAVKIWTFTIWLTATVFGGILFSTFYEVRNETDTHSYENYGQWPSCSVKVSDNGVEKQMIYYTFSSTTFMLLPMLILTVSSSLIAREIIYHQTGKSAVRKNRERKAVCQLGLISASFLVGYVPMTIYVMWTTRMPHGNHRLDYWMHVASYFMLRTSECLNPIIYNIASPNMRRASLRVIHNLRFCSSWTEVKVVKQRADHGRREYPQLSPNGKPRTRRVASPQKQIHSPGVSQSAVYLLPRKRSKRSRLPLENALEDSPRRRGRSGKKQCAMNVKLEERRSLEKNSELDNNNMSSSL